MTDFKESEIHLKIGKTLKEIRKEKKLTLRVLQDSSDQYATRISSAENGKLNLTLGWIVRYCEVLDIKPTDLFVRAFQEDFKSIQLERIFNKFDELKVENSPDEKE